MIEKKPKCHGCGERGNDVLYYWHTVKGIPGGHLWHCSCIEKISDEIKKNKEGHEKT